MSVAFISTTKDPAPWIQVLNAQDPTMKIHIHGQGIAPKGIKFALAWNHSPGAFEQYPDLEVICSMGAGVDHLFRDPSLPPDVKICRIVDDQLSAAMSEFVIAQIMNHLKRLNIYKQDQLAEKWRPRPYLMITDVTIGIMGFGQLGRHLANVLLPLGFSINGWSASKKTFPGVHLFSGNQNLAEFLQKTDILVCMLPLTFKTKGILNKKTFQQLPESAFVINVARGGHLVENDLIDMIEKGHLSGAGLDVFETEPLPKNHPFWTHPKIHITPHIASLTDPASVAPQILENYRRMEEGLPLLNTVSKKKGY